MSRLRESLSEAISSDRAEGEERAEYDTPVRAENGPVSESYGNLGMVVDSDRTVYEAERGDTAVGYSNDYEVNIRKITSGYILRVGCQEIAVESGSDVAKLIGIYLSGDKTIGDKWMNSEKIVQNFIKENLEIK